MSLLSIAQDVCDEIGLPRPANVASATDQLGRQIFSLAKAELRELSKRYNWPVLVREHSLNTVIGQAAYAKPADFRALVGDTAYNHADYSRVRGSVSPSEWQELRGRNLSDHAAPRFRISGSSLNISISPTPDAVETIVFEYVTKNLAASSVGAAQETYVIDTDVALIDEGLVSLGLKWRLKHAKGLDFGADRAEYDSVVSREFARSLGSPTIVLGGKRFQDDGLLTNGYVPDTGFGA